MELIDKLEQRFDKLSNRIKELEEEVQFLKSELETERNNKQAVHARIEKLLSKIQEESE